MDTQSLKTFLTLTEYKNFTKTADVLFVAQSTVTNRIAELEKEVGKQLFTRTKRNVALTKEGAIFLGYAKRMIELAETSIQDMNSLKKYQSTMRIGTTNTIYECHLFPYIRDYMDQHPKDAIKITMGHSADLLTGLQDHVFDVIYSYLPLYKSGYSCEVFAVDNLILVTNAKNHACPNGISQDELKNANYLYCNFALQEVGLFIRELFPPHFQFGFEIDNSTKLIPYLLEFDGISFLPESIAAPYLQRKELQSIELLGFDAPKINCYKIQPL